MTQKNQCFIHTDDVCVYVNVKARNPIAGLIVLFLADLLILSVTALAIVVWIPGLLLFSLLILIFLTRYTLWSIYGAENLIINTKSIAYQHDYGFFKTSYITKPFNRALKVRWELQRTDDMDAPVTLSFVTYNENDLPIIIYQMALQVTVKDAQEILSEIDRLYLSKLMDDNFLPEINLN